MQFLSDDILKYIFDCEYTNTPCRLDNLTGHLHSRPEVVTRALEQLLSEKQIQIETDNRYSLTDRGRSRALSVIRKHRLIERYLAEETGTQATHWHTMADAMEHYISDAELEDMTRRMGNPVFDPHGDPIPTTKGEIPQRMKELTVLDLEVGESAIINHLEDEPASIYHALLKKGIYPQLIIKLINKSTKQRIIQSHLGETALSPMEAAAINVQRLSSRKKFRDYIVPLYTVPTGQTRTIIGISEDLRGRQRRRLLDLGFVPGNEVTPMLDSPGKNTRAYEILNTLIALRSDQAAKILVTDENYFEEE